MQDFPETRHSLLVRVQQDDADAWNEFSEIYRPLFYRIARRRGRQDATIAADADFETNTKRLELNLAEAEAELAYTKEEYDAAKTLHERSATNVSESRLRKVALQHRQASINVERARLELEAAKRREK